MRRRKERCCCGFLECQIIVNAQIFSWISQQRIFFGISLPRKLRKGKARRSRRCKWRWWSEMMQDLWELLKKNWFDEEEGPQIKKMLMEVMRRNNARFRRNVKENRFHEALSAMFWYLRWGDWQFTFYFLEIILIYLLSSYKLWWYWWMLLHMMKALVKNLDW